MEAGKKAAGIAAINEYVTRDNMTLGIGSGSTIVFAIERLAQLVQEKKIQNIICVPTSSTTAKLLEEAKLKIGSLDEHDVLDVAIDGADEVDEKLNLIKGGGGYLTQEKIVADCAKKLVIVADASKKSTKLGLKYKHVPIEVIPMAIAPISRKLTAIGGAPHLRKDKTNPNTPFITDNHNCILDVEFGSIESPQQLHEKLIAMVGVVETGLFCNMAQKVIFGENDGSTSVWTR